MILTSISLGTGFLLTTKLVITGQILIVPIFEIIGFFYTIILLPAMIYLHRDTLETFLDCVHNNAFSPKPKHSTILPKFVKPVRPVNLYNSGSKILFFYTLWFCLVQLMIICPLGGFFLETDNFFRDPSYHMWTFPFLDRTPSFSVYLMIYPFQIMVSECMAILYFFPMVLPEILILEMYNIVLCYCSRIQDLIYFMHHQTNRRTLRFEKAFEDTINVFLKEHQDFRRYVISY